MRGSRGQDRAKPCIRVPIVAASLRQQQVELGRVSTMEMAAVQSRLFENELGSAALKPLSAAPQVRVPRLLTGTGSFCAQTLSVTRSVLMIHLLSSAEPMCDRIISRGVQRDGALFHSDGKERAALVGGAIEAYCFRACPGPPSLQ